ncbi:MAG: META domain-containing protein [Prolixibacteraceae bacterium]|jgi:heat shock protein HslJ|nr:META domain-containing protein [Prolixibacteraceae bacterium]
MRTSYLLAVFLFVLGCSTSKKIADNSSAWPDDMEGTQWKLIALNGQKIAEENTGPKQVYLMFVEEENRFYGSGGCNAINGMYIHSKANHLEFSNIASTKMACMKMGVEHQFLNMLKEVDNYQLKGDTLVLKVNKEAVSRFIAN